MSARMNEHNYQYNQQMFVDTLGKLLEIMMRENKQDICKMHYGIFIYSNFRVGGQ